MPAPAAASARNPACCRRRPSRCSPPAGPGRAAGPLPQGLGREGPPRRIADRRAGRAAGARLRGPHRRTRRHRNRGCPDWPRAGTCCGHAAPCAPRAHRHRLPLETLTMATTTLSHKPADAAACAPARSLWQRQRWLILRRATQLSILLRLPGGPVVRRGGSSRAICRRPSPSGCSRSPTRCWCCRPSSPAICPTRRR